MWHSVVHSSAPLLITLLLNGPAPSAAAEYEKGISLQKQGKYDEAIRVLEAAAKLEAPPALAADIHFELAETYFRKGKEAHEGKLDGVDPQPLFRTAARLFGETATRFRGNQDTAGQATYMVGSSHLMLGDMKAALASYETAYRDFPQAKNRPGALVRIGVGKAGIGDIAGARTAYQQFLKLYPDHNLTKKVRGYLHQTAIVGRRAPPIRASEWLHGITPNGLASVEGEVVVMVFIASWCHNCKSVLPHLKREIAYWSNRGVIFLGISNPDDPKNTMAPSAYVRSNELEFLDVALDNGGRSWHPYRVTGLPAAGVVDRRGIIRWRGHFSFLSHTLIEMLLNE